MATARKTTSKTSASNQSIRRAVDKAPIASSHGAIEETVRVKLDGGMIVDVNISIGSTPKVGPGPKPKRDELLLVSRISDSQVMTVSVELNTMAMPTAGIVVGSGKRPGTGGN